MSTAIYRLPKAFASDHWGRDCGTTDEVVRETKSHYYVKMDADGYSDMLSDADYYCFMPGDFLEAGMSIGFIASARATLAALRKQGPPAPVEPTTEEPPAACGCDVRWLCAEHAEIAPE